MYAPPRGEGVEGACRLVEQQHQRAQRQSNRDSHTLCLAALRLSRWIGTIVWGSAHLDQGRRKSDRAGHVACLVAQRLCGQMDKWTAHLGGAAGVQRLFVGEQFCGRNTAHRVMNGRRKGANRTGSETSCRGSSPCRCGHDGHKCKQARRTPQIC
eukprot:363324-Chlamydomonas_euryale.AAC.28